MLKITSRYFSMFSNTPPTSWVWSNSNLVKFKLLWKFWNVYARKHLLQLANLLREVFVTVFVLENFWLSGQITLQFWPKSLSNKEKTNFPLRVYRRKIVLKCLLPFATSVREDHYSFLVTIKRKHCCLDLLFINPFWPNVSFLYLLKTSESFLFSDVFRGYRNRPLG